jgi:signal transduction histidine kinase/sugar phosphate isomerase/epimerase
MKLGFQTIIWGPRIEDLEGALDIIAAAGYQGVEFAQRPDMLHQVRSIYTLLELLEKRHLALIGLAGGSLHERMRFCQNFRPAYLYVEDWDPHNAPEAVAKGFTLALHPHVFKAIHRLDDAEKLLKKYPELKFLADTSHLTIAGDDPVEAIRRTRDQLIGVHLKDWAPGFGRSSHQYARGFTELGEGIVPLEAVVQELRRMNYAGWAVVEQNRTWTEPQTSIRKCSEWLSKRGLLELPKRTERNVESSWGSSSTVRKCSTAQELEFLRTLLRAGTEEMSRCYERIAKAFQDLIPSDLVTVWACSSAHDFMSHLAVMPLEQLSKNVLRSSKALMGVAVDQQTVIHFDLTDLKKYPDREFGCPELLDRGFRRMVTVPIFDAGQHNHVRLLITFFPQKEKLPATDEELLWFGMAVARAANSALDLRCWFAAVNTNLLAGQSGGLKDFMGGLVALIQKLVGCEGLSIFLVNELKDRLELAATTGIKWEVSKEEEFYRKGEGLTGRVWERNEARLAVDIHQEPDRAEKSAEQVPTTNASWLLAPLTDSKGEVIGVVRCQNKQVTHLGACPMFSDDDVAIVNAVGLAAVPHLQVLLGEERRAKALRRVTHELKTPLVAIRGAVQMMQRELARHKTAAKDFFDYDYLEDIWSWCELMRRLLGNADIFHVSASSMPIRAERTLLMKEVVAPAVRQVGSLLRERNFSAGSISYGRFEQVPRLWIDRNHFQQVMFNLLSNAIKYAYQDPGAFSIVIEGAQQRGEFVIRFRDWGPGIGAGLEEVIFEEGVRGPGAVTNNVAGQGLGLWVVRQVVEAHGGRIQLTKHHLPTEFTICLPETLAHQPPGKQPASERREQK